MGTLLDHRGALTIVFAHHDQSAAHHTGRGQIGQGVSRHIGAHNRLPGHRAAQRVVQAGTEHGCGRGFVGTGFDMHTQLVHEGLGLHHHIEQMRHRRTLVAADVSHARLEQGFGDGQNALAVEGVALAQAQRLDLMLK